MGLHNDPLFRTGKSTLSGVKHLRGDKKPTPLYPGLMITLPIPPKELSPNARVHWAVKAKHAKASRQIAAMLGKQAGSPKYTRANVRIVWYKPTKRSRDSDNSLAMCKSFCDGLADAGIIKNDSGFRFMPIEFMVDKSNPRIEIYVEEDK